MFILDLLVLKTNMDANDRNVFVASFVIRNKILLSYNSPTTVSFYILDFFCGSEYGLYHDALSMFSKTVLFQKVGLRLLRFYVWSRFFPNNRTYFFNLIFNSSFFFLDVHPPFEFPNKRYFLVVNVIHWVLPVHWFYFK